MSAISTDSFFKIKRDASEIKSEIFVKYFKFWCGVLLYGQKYRPINELLYIDLFSGPGRYANGDPSTPIKIMDSIIASSGTHIDLNKSVKTFFNDEKKSLIDALEKNLNSLPYYNKLTHQPALLNKPASKNVLDELLKKGTPSLTFIDPFGYSYSMEMLLNSVKEWGSDLFMLFNINRIRAAIKNPLVEVLMNEIFQQELTEIRTYYANEKHPAKREVFIINRFENLFRNKGYFVFKFRICFPDKNQTSHYLYLITKVRLAYLKIKEIMKGYSDYQPDGVPLFSVNSKQNPIFYPEVEKYSIHGLTDAIKTGKKRFHGRTIDMIYEEHCLNTNFIKENYKTVFNTLFDEGVVEVFNEKGIKSNRITYNCTVNFK